MARGPVRAARHLQRYREIARVFVHLQLFSKTIS